MFTSAVSAREVVAVPKVLDVTAPAMEFDLPAGDRLRPMLAWISDQDLLATALISPNSPFWENRVVRVDVKSRQISEVIPQGVLLCANATAGRAGMLVGSLASSFVSGSDESKPVETVFEWNRPLRQLTPAATQSEVNPWICRPVRPEHRKGPMQGRNADVTYLEPRHGVLRMLPDAKAYRTVHLEKDGKRLPVDLRHRDVLDTPEYLAFRDAYLIAAGSTLAESFYRDENGEAQQESPIITMTPEGKVTRSNPRGALSRAGLVADALVRPYRQGLLVISHAAPTSGGGIYKLDTIGAPSPGTLQRVWCSDKFAERDGTCKIEQFALSPNGCQLAFYAKGQAQTPSPSPALARLRVIDLCRATSR